MNWEAFARWLCLASSTRRFSSMRGVEAGRVISTWRALDGRSCARVRRVVLFH